MLRRFFRMGNNNVDEQEIESDVDEVKSAVDEQEMESDVDELKSAVDEQEMESDVDEVKSAVDEQEEMEGDVDEMKSAVDEQEMEGDVDEMKSAVDEQEMESDVDELKSSVDEQEEVESDFDDEQDYLESDDDEQEFLDSDDEEQEDLESKANEQDLLISSFLEVVVGQSVQTAKQYLQATNWEVEDAVRLFYSQDVRYPDTLYENNNYGATANVRAEMERPDDSRNLPLKLMYKGLFHEAKQVAETQDMWLIVNVQSKKEFDSYTLNLHTWRNEAVSQTIGANFIFWQVYDDITEGLKMCNFYKLTSFPAILILDPITGQKVKSWSGMIEAVQLLEDLAPFMDAGPKHHHAQLCRKRPTETSQQTTVPETTKEDAEVLLASPASTENMTASGGPTCSDTDEPVISSSKKLTYPDLPEEPKVEKTLLCRIGVRLPDGRRLQRNFLLTDPLQLLWSFCSSQLDEAESRPFQLTQAIPGASKVLDYEWKQTFEESGLANSMISVTWD